jgi:hypothetical protein
MPTGWNPTLEVYFHAIGFYRVTDTLESGSILIYLVQKQSIYTQSSGVTPYQLKQKIRKRE